jgi:probable phosphoglycerate mutase
MPTTILLIRHALTDVVGRTLTGTSPGIHLNAIGRQQVERLAEHLRAVPIAVVASSPMERARETAEPIARARGVDVRIDAAFTEYEFGEWTGMSFEALDSDQGWRQFNASRGTTRPPKGELMLEVQQRMVAGLLALAVEWPGQTVAVVSHGDPIRAAVMSFLGMPLDLVHHLEIGPARISIIELQPGQPPRVRLVNADTVPPLA